jgi:hypothetical protein
LQLTVNEAVAAIRCQVSALNLQLSAAQTQGAISGDAGQAIEAAVARMAGKLRAELQDDIDHLSRRIGALAAPRGNIAHRIGDRSRVQRPPRVAREHGGGFSPFRG